MPAALELSVAAEDLVARFVADHHREQMKPWRSTVMAARTFCGRLDRAGGWELLSASEQLAAVQTSPRFAAWLFVTVS